VSASDNVPHLSAIASAVSSRPCWRRDRTKHCHSAGFGETDRDGLRARALLQGIAVNDCDQIVEIAMAGAHRQTINVDGGLMMSRRLATNRMWIGPGRLRISRPSRLRANPAPLGLGKASQPVLGPVLSFPLELRAISTQGRSLVTRGR